MSEPEYRCPTCGRFVSPDEGFYDAEPGGCRGSSAAAAYCDEGCATAMYLRAHAGDGIAVGGDPCDCEP